MGNPIIFLFSVILVLSLSDRESFEKATRTYKTTVDYFKNQHPLSKENIENEIIPSLNFFIYIVRSSADTSCFDLIYSPVTANQNIQCQ